MRTERIGSATLYLADCRDVLPTLSGIDAVVSDPPYGIGFQKGPGGRGIQRHTRPLRDKVVGDDEPFNPTHLIGFPEVLLWGADHFSSLLPHGRWLAWDKLDKIESFDSFADVEFAWLNKPGASRLFRHMWKGICQASEKDTERHHATVKPIALMAWCLEFIAGHVVCDPYMGSGTTGVACVRLGRRFIGTEIDADYFDIACRRIEEAQRQRDLFVDAPVPEPPEDERMADLFTDMAAD